MMIFGKLKLGTTALHTHNDSYVLAGITAVSTRRPLWSVGLLVGALSATFTLSFADILYPNEIRVIVKSGRGGKKARIGRRF